MGMAWHGICRCMLGWFREAVLDGRNLFPSPLDLQALSFAISAASLRLCKYMFPDFPAEYPNVHPISSKKDVTTQPFRRHWWLHCSWQHLPGHSFKGARVTIQQEIKLRTISSPENAWSMISAIHALHWRIAVPSNHRIASVACVTVWSLEHPSRWPKRPPPKAIWHTNSLAREIWKWRRLVRTKSTT